MFKTTSSKVSLLLAIGLAVVSYYMYLEIPIPINIGGRMATPPETDYLSLDYLKLYAPALGSILLFFNSTKDRELKKKELELKERELNHKIGKDD